MKKECSISISLNTYTGNKIPAIKLLRSVEPIGLREAKELIESMDELGIYHRCFLSKNDIKQLKLFGFDVVEKSKDCLPENLFSFNEMNKRDIIYENGRLKIYTSEIDFSIHLTEEEKNILIKSLME